MKIKALFLICAVMFSFAIHAAPFEQDTFNTQNGKKIIITFFRHATLMIEYDKYCIQVDPLTQYVDYSTYPKANAILITHEHGDHLDEKAISLLENKETLLIGNGIACSKLKKGKTLANNEKHIVSEDIVVEAVPAYNTTPGRENFHPKGQGNGYVLTLGGTRIYIAGDTEDIPEMSNLKNIDIAFLPVNQPNTMTVPQTIRAAKMFNPKVLYPYHYGRTPISEIISDLKIDKIDVRVKKWNS